MRRLLRLVYNSRLDKPNVIGFPACITKTGNAGGLDESVVPEIEVVCRRKETAARQQPFK